VAKAIILKEAGTHFDPRVVGAFLANEKSFVEIGERFRDGQIFDAANDRMTRDARSGPAGH
jgi:HD-GYP domain-containing protein (c-di-GMP phosphodiesterase class II)